MLPHANCKKLASDGQGETQISPCRKVRLSSAMAHVGFAGVLGSHLLGARLSLGWFQQRSLFTCRVNSWVRGRLERKGVERNGVVANRECEGQRRKDTNL